MQLFNYKPDDCLGGFGPFSSLRVYNGQTRMLRVVNLKPHFPRQPEKQTLIPCLVRTGYPLDLEPFHAASAIPGARSRHAINLESCGQLPQTLTTQAALGRGLVKLSILYSWGPRLLSIYNQRRPGLIPSWPHLLPFPDRFARLDRSPYHD